MSGGGVWQRALYSVERDGEVWIWCFAGHGESMTETAALESGKTAVERGRS